MKLTAETATEQWALARLWQTNRLTVQTSR